MKTKPIFTNSVKFTIVSILALIALSGCNQMQEQAQNLRKSGETLVNEASQQAQSTKTQIIQTKQKIDQKVQDLQDASKKIQDASDAVKKLSQ